MSSVFDFFCCFSGLVCMYFILLYCLSAGGREDGSGRDSAHGGHGAVQRGASRRHEATVGRQRRPGVLWQVQWIPAERLSKIVSSLSPWCSRFRRFLFADKTGCFSKCIDRNWVWNELEPEMLGMTNQGWILKDLPGMVIYLSRILQDANLYVGCCPSNLGKTKKKFFFDSDQTTTRLLRLHPRCHDGWVIDVQCWLTRISQFYCPTCVHRLGDPRC